MDGNFLRKKKKNPINAIPCDSRYQKKQNMETMEPNGVEDSIDS